ncbi:DmX-like protein 1 [Babesia microti strain RI]|uniref:DmX-like protein 1 n=1 Tax=Babesia microti (strain RI) TaxID=1133968 RepID=I7IPB8_BABMR|nr:DmX-like protein 1 [Babesia microti strain RI]CCF72830.1 DmX-like protein 1 [Babesia microti strain RI]|eukprot:XP_012647439.1 DmX-like protein 1 [Babesia microti strain RI]
MYLRILDIQKGVQNPFVLAKSPGESKGLNLYIAPLPKDAIERIKKHGKPKVSARKRLEGKNINSIKSIDRIDTGFHMHNYIVKTKMKFYRSNHNSKNSANKFIISNISCEESERWDQFDAKVTKFGKKGFQCISFSHKVIRAHWKPEETKNKPNRGKFEIRNFGIPKPQGSFVVLTSDGVLRLFVIRNGKSLSSLSITINQHSPRRLRWIWVVDECKTKKEAIKYPINDKFDFSDLIVWSTQYYGGGIVGIYRIRGIDSANLHVWADCILTANSVNLKLCGRGITKATYSWTGNKYIACRIVESREQIQDCSASGEWVMLIQNDDLRNQYQGRAFSRILPPVALTLAGRHNRVKVIITPYALLKGTGTGIGVNAKMSSCSQMKDIKYGVYTMSTVTARVDSDSLASLCGISGYIKSILLENHMDYRSTVVVLYPNSLHVCLMECLNPCQTLYLNAVNLAPWCAHVAVDISAVTLGQFSLIAVLSGDTVALFSLKRDLSLHNLCVIDVGTGEGKRSVFKLWCVGPEAATLQVNSSLVSLFVASEGSAGAEGAGLNIVRHEYTFPPLMPAASACGCNHFANANHFAAALVKFGQFSLLRRFLQLQNSNSHIFSFDVLRMMASAGGPCGRPAVDGIAKFFTEVPWDDADFRDVDMNAFLGNGVQNKRASFVGSSFASAQFKLMAAVIGNSDQDCFPFLSNANGETTSLAYWARMYGRDIELVEYLASAFTGRDDVFTLVHRLQVGQWVSSAPALAKLADWVIKELVRIVKSQVDTQNDAMDHLGLWCIATNKVRLFASLTRLQKNEKLANFLLNDFSDPQWRANAEKNAFASISKQRYHIAVGFFILADKWEEAVSLVDQRINCQSWSLLLKRLRPDVPFHAPNPDSDPNEASSFNFITEAHDVSVQKLLNFAATFGPYALYLVATRFGVDYFKPLLVQLLLPVDLVQLVESADWPTAEAILDCLPECAHLNLPTVPLATVGLAHGLWHSSPKRLVHALKTAAVALYICHGAKSATGQGMDIALLCLVAALAVISNGNLSNMKSSQRLISLAERALVGSADICESIHLLWDITESPNCSSSAHFLGVFEFDRSIDSLFNLRVLFHAIVQVFNLLQVLRRLNEIDHRTCAPIYSLNVESCDGEDKIDAEDVVLDLDHHFCLDSYLSHIDLAEIERIHSPIDLYTDADESYSALVSVTNRTCNVWLRTCTRDYFCLDMLQRLQWELCVFADDFSSKLVPCDPAPSPPADDSLLTVPAGKLLGLTNQAQFNELISFIDGPMAGLLFRDWSYRSESAVPMPSEESSNSMSADRCTSGCLFTICSLLKKLKGKNISSFKGPSGVYSAGVLSGGMAVLVTSISDPDHLSPGVYKVDISLADCFAILHTLKNCHINVSLSRNHARLAIIDSFGWINVYKIPQPRNGLLNSKAREKNLTLSGIHCFTFRSGDHGKALTWVFRGDNQGPLLATITGCPSDRSRAALDMDTVGDWVCMGKNKYPNGQQLSFWLLYAGREEPSLGLSAGVDSDVAFTCVAATIVGEVTRLFVGDDGGCVRVLDVSKNMVRVSGVVNCLGEAIVEVICCEEYLLVIGAKATAITLPLDLGPGISRAWKIVSLLDNLEMTCVRAAKLASSRLLVIFGMTCPDRLLIHHAHLPHDWTTHD